MTQLLVSTMTQIVLFLTLPFIWWLFSGRRHTPFFKWLGLKKPKIANKKKFAFMVGAMLIISFISFLVITPIFVSPENLATHQFNEQGMSGLILVLMYAYFQTGLSEELLFRGFLTKRLIVRFGFHIGNIVQGFIFGAVHGVMVLPFTDLLGIVTITLLTAMIGYILGWLNEKEANGSIIPSWLLHGTINMIVGTYTLFT